MTLAHGHGECAGPDPYVRKSRRLDGSTLSVDGQNISLCDVHLPGCLRVDLHPAAPRNHGDGVRHLLKKGTVREAAVEELDGGIGKQVKASPFLSGRGLLRG